MPTPVVVKWRLVTLDLLTTYTFAVNPNAMDSFLRARVVDQQTTTAPDGNVIISEGARPLKSTNFKGTLLDKAQHDALMLWLESEDTGTVCYLDDHLGRRWPIYITDFQPVPKISSNYPWKHDYTVMLLVLGPAAVRPA